jgi:hypothetical protein
MPVESATVATDWTPVLWRNRAANATIAYAGGVYQVTVYGSNTADTPRWISGAHRTLEEAIQAFERR